MEYSDINSILTYVLAQDEFTKTYTLYKVDNNKLEKLKTSKSPLFKELYPNMNGGDK